MTNDLVKASTSRNGKAVAITAVILVSIHRTKPIFKLGQEIDKCNAYMKFGSNQMTDEL